MTDAADAQELAALRSLSASIGANPRLTQAAGGNSSLKLGDTLWIQASGTCLKGATAEDIMVPVAMSPLPSAVERRDRAADRPQAFAIEALNPRKLRPSIETTVHALMRQRVVLHVHCVDTIALAVRADCEAQITARLGGLRWTFIEAHAVAIDPESCRMAGAGSLYPDHVIFLGQGSVVARPGETVARTIERHGAAPVVILFPGAGVLMRGDACASAQAMQRCLADVTARVDVTAQLKYLTAAENDALINWDAEQYRQKLNASG